MLKFILIAIVVIYVFAKLSKYMIRWALLFAGQKLQKEFEKQQGQHATYTSSKDYGQSGKVTVHIPRDEAERSRSYQGGDYVDFEELPNEPKN